MNTHRNFQRTFSLYVEDKDPAVAAAIVRERALLQAEGKVYVRPFVRRWPGGLVAARRAMRKAQKRTHRIAAAIEGMRKRA